MSFPRAVVAPPKMTYFRVCMCVSVFQGLVHVSGRVVVVVVVMLLIIIHFNWSMIKTSL